MSYGSVIAAISTPSGKGGVALIRVSGAGAVEICERVFKPKSDKKLSEIAPRKQVWGDIYYKGEKIDDGMAAVFRAPASYTGEDTVEISCHGGILLTERVLEALFIAGAMPAERGEFTERAFINGKISLAEAESIANLLDAKSDEQIRLSSFESRSRLTEAIGEIRAELTSLLASVFARIDYPDEDLGDMTSEEILTSLAAVRERTERLISSFTTARAISEGIKTVICGRPNVGKSSLYNAILGEDAAIVTEIEGTTRDILTREVPIGRVMLRLSDTAGIRDSEKADAVERIGIDRTRAAMDAAELIIAVFDGSSKAGDEDRELIRSLCAMNAPKIALLNKSDLEAGFESDLLCGFDSLLSVSAKESPDDAKARLGEIVDRLFTDERLVCGHDPLVATARQNAALISAREYIDAATLAFGTGEFTDAAASEIELALGAVSEIDGRAVVDGVLSEIFSKFCVGK